MSTDYDDCDAESVLNGVDRLWGWFTAVDIDRSGHISAHELREFGYWFMCMDGLLNDGIDGMIQRRLL